MEAWITVAVAFIVALSTLGATFIQNRHSAKRFERELERAREADYHQRRWEVRGEPIDLPPPVGNQRRSMHFRSSSLGSTIGDIVRMINPS